MKRVNIQDYAETINLKDVQWRCCNIVAIQKSTLFSTPVDKKILIEHNCGFIWVDFPSMISEDPSHPFTNIYDAMRSIHNRGFQCCTFERDKEESEMLDFLKLYK